MDISNDASDAVKCLWKAIERISSRKGTRRITKKHSTFKTMKGGRFLLTASCAYVPVRRSRFRCCCWSCRLPQVLAVSVVSFSLFILLFCCCYYCSSVVVVAIVIALMTRRKTKRREFRVIFVFIFSLLTLKNSVAL